MVPTRSMTWNITLNIYLTIWYSRAVKLRANIPAPFAVSVPRAVQLSTCVWWRAARLMLTTTWASTAGTWLEGRRSLPKPGASSWTFQVSHWVNVFIETQLYKGCRVTGMKWWRSAGSLTFGKIVILLYAIASQKKAMRTGSTTQVINFSELFMVTNSSYWVLSLSAHTYFRNTDRDKERGSDWLCTLNEKKGLRNQIWSSGSHAPHIAAVQRFRMQEKLHQAPLMAVCQVEAVLLMVDVLWKKQPYLQFLPRHPPMHIQNVQW